MSERVQKILREWGIASRREAENLIREGRIKVNGVLVNLGDQANPKTDKIELDGKTITGKEKPNLVYILLNKPKGIICTCEDPQNRQTVLDLLSPALKSGQGIHPVGRLDRNSTGALLLTNDGSFTLNLTHPRYHLPKTYLVGLIGNVSKAHLKQWAEGFMWEGKKTLPTTITIMEKQPNRTLIEIILTEGRNRQIRRIAEHFGYSVNRLHRTAIGSIKISKLTSGSYRFLTPSEVKQLQSDFKHFSHS